MRSIYYRCRALFVTWLLRRLPRQSPLVYQGPGSARTLAGRIALLGYRKLLLVSDEQLAAAGVLDGIRQALDTAGVDYAVYTGVLPDPGFDQVQAGEALLASAGCEAVLAVGGGSVLDVGKMIAMLHLNPGKLADFDGIQKAARPGLPLFAVPTTAGTGSEITLAAVITDPDSGHKVPVVDSRMIPDYIALDASLMLGLPRGVTAASGMDALTHAVESYLSRAATPVTQRQSRAAVRLVFTYLPRAWERGDDLEARDAMATAAFYAGAAFSRAALGYVHGIAHELGRICHLPHGLANAMVLPEVLEGYGECIHAQLAELALLLSLGTGGEEPAILARRFIEAVAALRSRLEIPAQAAGLEAADVPAIVAAARAEAGGLYPVPRYLSDAELGGIVRGLLPAA